MNLIATTVAKPLGRIYIVIPFLKKLKIGETINRYINDNGDIDIGTIVEILILNRACGFNTPLYGIADWAKEHGVDEIYGIPAEKLNDDRIGDVLDKISAHLNTIDCQITVNMLKLFDIDVSRIHFDASSFTVVGKPSRRAGDAESIHVTYGRGSEGRLDQRQVRIGLATSGNGNIPLLGSAYSGNVTDYQMHPEFLENLRQILNSSDFIFVADSKFDSNDNFKDIFLHNGYFLCAGAFLPTIQKFFLSLSEQEIEWEEIDYVSKENKKKPKHKRPIYEAFEVEQELTFKVDGKKKTYHYRLIFVYSSDKAKQEKQTRKKRILKIAKKLAKIQSLLNKGKYIERDYILKKINEVLSLNPMGKLFSFNLYEKSGLFYLEYFYDDQKIAQLEKLDGIYLLKTNLDKEEYPLEKVLKTYKQQAQIEHRIKAIKGPLKVAPIFLKDPKRIAALFCLIVQALKIYCIIEQETREGLKYEQEELEILPEKRKTKTPCGETILKAFDHSVYMLIEYDKHENKIRRLTSPNELQRKVFRMLYMTPPTLKSLSRKFGKFRSKKRASP